MTLPENKLLFAFIDDTASKIGHARHLHVMEGLMLGAGLLASEWLDLSGLLNSRTARRPWRPSVILVGDPHTAATRIATAESKLLSAAIRHNCLERVQQPMRDSTPATHEEPRWVNAARRRLAHRLLCYRCSAIKAKFRGAPHGVSIGQSRDRNHH